MSETSVKRPEGPGAGVAVNGSSTPAAQVDLLHVTGGRTVETAGGETPAAPGTRGADRERPDDPQTSARPGSRPAKKALVRLFADQQFRRHRARYVLQCSLATVSVMGVLVILDAITNAAVIASLGASSFIAFTMPETRSSQARFMVGGYLVGIAAGTSCYGLSLLVAAEPGPFNHYLYAFFGAMSVGLAIFLMVVTNTEHPPAAGVALGLVLNEWSILTITVVLVGIVALSLLKWALRPVLKNLL